MNRIRIALCALLLALCVLGLTAGAGKPDKLHVVFFQDAAGVQHTYTLDKPVAFSDALGVRSAIIGLAQKEHARGSTFADSFLLAAEGNYMQGSLCYITARSGGRYYYCGQCGGLGCASVKVISN